ncbi:MAG TPA: response regulator [Candidatus Nanoarchaeia archaeon]|nr:response regulator [Candidatus Nanoarchaeia archaeon]
MTDKPSTILIVEDEPGFRRTYCDLFTHYGHNVLEAENGQIGWELAGKELPDIILLDLVMPVMTGYELLSKLHEDDSTKKIPVIIFSVLGEQTDIQKALELGASDYIVKGFYSPQEVLGKIGKFLAKADIQEVTD